MEYLAIVRLRAIAEAEAAMSASPQTEGDNAKHGALIPASSLGAVDKAVSTNYVSPPKSKGIKGPILLCVSYLENAGDNR